MVWAFYALYQAIFVFVLCYYCLEQSAVYDGKMGGLWYSGNIAYSACIIIANLVILREHHNVVYLNVGLVLASILLYYFVFWFENLGGFEEYFYDLTGLYGHSIWNWLNFLTLMFVIMCVFSFEYLLCMLLKLNNDRIEQEKIDDI
jgi:hypothetical protein